MPRTDSASVASTRPRTLALVTGGTSGIGRAAARLLAVEHDLALAYAGNHGRANAFREELQREVPGLTVKVFPGLLRGHAHAARLVREVQSAFGRSPLVLVNAAGHIHDELFLESEFGTHEDLLAEHLVVPMALAHLVIRQMYRERFGRIVNLSSIAARYSKRGQSSYSGAKAGLEGFTRTLALEVAHRGITVNAVAPGLIDTPLVADVIRRIRQGRRGLGKTIPAGQVGRPEEVGHLVQFLCSERAAYITGAVITIDGGRALGDPEL